MALCAGSYSPGTPDVGAKTGAVSLDRTGLNPIVWLLAIMVCGAVGVLGGSALVRVLRAAGV